MTTNHNHAALLVRESYQEGFQHIPELQRYRKRRWGQVAEFAGWLTASQLPSLSTEQALVLYRASAGTRLAEFKSNPIEEVRDSLDFLLHDTVKLEGRFSECASDDGAYKLAGAGKEFVSYLLCLREPTLFAVWNSNAERAILVSGVYREVLRKKSTILRYTDWLIPPKTLAREWRNRLREGDVGLRYVDVLEALQGLRQQLTLAHFQEVDEVCYLVSQQGKLGIKYGSAL